MKKLNYQQVKSIFQNAILLSGFAMFCVAPMFYHNLKIWVNTNDQLSPENFQQLYLNQLCLFFILVFLCSIVGFLYQTRFNLHFGRFKQIKGWAMVGGIMGLLATPLLYFSIDSLLLTVRPDLYLLSSPFAIAEMLGSAISQEIILRFGLLTLFIYFSRLFKIQFYFPMVFLISSFTLFNIYQFLVNYQVIEYINTQTLYLLLASAFLLQCLLCYIYLYFGLIAVIAFHVMFNIRFLIYALFFTTIN